MSRLKTTFEQLAKTNRKALIPFITAGFPRLETTLPLMHALVKAGADIIELGVPFSDPMADGPTIQRASEEALRQGIHLRHILEIVSQFRQENLVTPIVLMGYANPIEALGLERFATLAAAAGLDGNLAVDYPPEACSEYTQQLKQVGIDPIFLLAPTSTQNRIEQIRHHGSGYVYYVSLTGITGAGHLDISAVADKLPQLRSSTGLPIAVGFGIKDPESAARIAGIADAVVVGSRIIEELTLPPLDTAIDRTANLVASFRQRIDSPQ